MFRGLLKGCASEEHELHCKELVKMVWTTPATATAETNRVARAMRQLLHRTGLESLAHPQKGSGVVVRQSKVELHRKVVHWWPAFRASLPFIEGDDTPAVSYLHTLLTNRTIALSDVSNLRPVPVFP